MKNDIINGHQFVDLGLRSGLLWATYNLGAAKPEDNGLLFSWGELVPKEVYLPETTPLEYKEMRDISGNPKFDAAREIWGAPWRMPNRWELQELWNHLYNTWKWIDDGNRTGLLGTASNGNEIFLPAAGEMRGDKLRDCSLNGCYWTSSPFNGNDIDNPAALKFFFCRELLTTHWHSRSHGCSIRPVADPNDTTFKFPLAEEDVYDIYGSPLLK